MNRDVSKCANADRKKADNKYSKEHLFKEAKIAFVEKCFFIQN